MNQFQTAIIIMIIQPEYSSVCKMREHGAQAAVIIIVCSATEQMSLFKMVIFYDNLSPKVKRVCTSLKGTHNPEALFLG